MQNFGKIKNTFNNLLVEGIAAKTDENKAIFRKFVKTINESRILKTQFNVYYSIERYGETNDFKSSEFVKESIGLLSRFKKEDILKENEKLISILKKHKLDVLEESYKGDELHENISTLIFTHKNTNNINKIVESLEKVISHVKSNVITESQSTEFLPNSFIGNLVVEKFNKKYETLGDDEKRVLKSIMESDEDGKKNILLECKNECISLLNHKLNESTDLSEKEALLNVKEALLEMEYTSETFINDIGRIIELKGAFNE